MLEKNAVLMGDGKGLADIRLMKASSASNILTTYRFKEEITRQAKTIDIAARSARGVEDLEFRGNYSVYLRTIGRQLQNEFSENNTRWGVADTYDHTR